MSEKTADSQETATAINVQRLESGYFDHLDSLRSQIPVGDYLVSPQTQRWALIVMALVSVAMLVLFPFTMFIQFTPVVTLLYMAGIVVVGWIFYERVVEPNEGTRDWRD